MTTVTATGSSSAAGTNPNDKVPTKELDKNAFLMLLVAQLKSQDPTQAQDPDKMVQQMTQFSSLEQAQQTNALLQGIQVQNQGLFQTQAAGLVGKRVKVTSPSFDLKDGKATMGIDLKDDAQVKLIIKDADGKVVATLDKGALKSGSHVIEWDGTGSDGNKLPDGAYTVEVDAKNADGTKVEVSASSYVKVESVLFVNGTVFIVAGGKRFSLQDISEVSA